MKKLLMLTLILSLCLTSALGEGFVPDNTPITVDGVRVAFFDAEGNYLPAQSLNGITYVPFGAFCQSTGINARAEGKILTVNGLRVGLFDESGNYLSPVEQGSLLYVPLTAFCQSAGLTVEKSAAGYQIALSGEAPAEKALPETVRVPLSATNFKTYFDIAFSTQNFENWEKRYNLNGTILRHQYWAADYVVTVTAKTGHAYENVKFSVSNPGSDYLQDYGVGSVGFHGLTMPQSGELVRSQHTEESYIGYAMVSSNTNLLKDDLFNRVSEVTGHIFLPYEEGQKELAALYARGQSYMDSEEYEEARSLFISLGDYENAPLLAQTAKEKLTAQKEAARAAQAEKQRQTYETALTALENGDYDAAISLFKSLNGYKDSVQKLEEANQMAEAARLAQEEADRAAAYEKAAQLEAAGDYAAAFDTFSELGDYKDAPQRAQAAVKKLELLEFEQLIIAEEYSQVKTRLKDDPQTRAELEARYPKLRFRLADSVFAFDKDGYAFFQENRKWGVIDWQGNVVHEPQWDSFPSGSRKGENGLYGYISSRGDLLLPYEYTDIHLFNEGYFIAEKNGAAYVLDGEGSVISQLPSGKTYQYHVGEGLIRFKDKKGKLGLTDLKGKIKVKAKYDYIGDFEYGMAEVYVKDKKGKFQRGLINPKGKEIIKPGKYEVISILGEDLLAVLKKNSTERHLVTLKGKSAGSLGNPKTLGVPAYGLLPICDELGFWGALKLDDLKGKKPLSTIYKEMTITARGTLAAVKENWWHLVKTDGSNDIITTYNYDEMSAGADSLYFAAKRGGGWYILDASGKEIY